MAQGTVTRNLKVYIDNTEAERALDQLRTKATRLETEIQGIQKAGGDATKQMQNLGQVNGQIKTLSDTLDKGLNKSLRDMQNELRRVEAQMKRATDPEDIQRLKTVWQSLKTQTDEYQKALYKVDRAQKGLKGLFGGIGSSVKGALFFGGIAGAVAAATSAVINFTRQAFQLSLQAEGVQRAFDRLNSPHLLDNLRKATRGTVSDLELMKRAVAFNNFKLPLDQLATYLKFAQQRARDTGQSVDYLVDSIVTGLGRKSVLILDNLGISAAEIHDEMKKTGDMTIAVSNIIKRQMGEAGDVMDTAADKVDRYRATIANLQKDWGDLVQGIVLAIDKFKDWTAAISGHDHQNDAANKYIQQQQEEYDQYSRSLTQTLQHQYDVLNGVGEKAGDTIQSINDEIKVLNDQLQTLPLGSKKFIETTKEIERLKKVLDEATGGKKTTSSDTANKQILTDQKQLVKDLEAIQDDLLHYYDDSYQKQIHAIEKKYAKEIELAHGNANLLKQIEETKNAELLQINQAYLEKGAEALRRAADAMEKDRQEKAAALLASQAESVNKGLQQAVSRRDAIDKATQERQAAALKARQEHLQQLFGGIQLFYNEALQAFSAFDQFLQSKEQQELARDQAVNDEKKANLQKQLNSKLITQQEYNAKTQKLDDDLAKKQKAIQAKEFERQKQIQAAQTAMAGARAAVQAYATLGPIAGPIAAAVVAAFTLAEIGLIESQKPPAYGEGGEMKGPKHSSKHKGLPVTDPVTGRVQAYLEGGEGVLKASAMDDRRIWRVTGTPSQIASSLNSAYGGVSWESGASLQPVWTSDAYVPMNFSRIRESRRMYAEGGVFNGKNAAESVQDRKQIEEHTRLMKEQNDLLRNAVILLSHPTRAVVSLQDLQRQSDRMNRILDDATMR